MLFCLCFITIFTMILLRAHAQSPICYSRTGVQTNEYFACQPDAAESACCFPGDICYSSGLCAAGPTEKIPIAPFSWNGCTDPTYSSPACLSACYNVSGNGVDVCANRGPNHFCCYGFNGCNCSDPAQVFSLAPATILTTIDPDITKSSGSTASSTARSSSMVSTSSIVASSTSVVLSSPAPAVTSTSPTPSTQPSKKANISLPIGIGIGVGVPIIIAIAAFIYYLMRRQRGRGVPNPPLMAPTAQEFDKSPHEMDVNLNSEVELPGQTEYQYRSGQYPLWELPAR